MDGFALPMIVGFALGFGKAFLLMIYLGHRVLQTNVDLTEELDRVKLRIAQAMAETRTPGATADDVYRILEKVMIGDG